jgi:hypothetical protein
MVLRAVACLMILPLTLARGAAPQSAGPVPVIYSSDLYHPHQDPDDHFDAATLFSIRGLDIRAVILDGGRRQLQAPGAIPLSQLMAIAGRRVPFAIGLGDPLKGPTDDGRGQPPDLQAGVELILRALRDADRPVTIITVGSLRDVAAAYNREPGLFRAKVGRLYSSIGNAWGVQDEYNASLDPTAFRRVVEADLPFYFVPCFGVGGPNAGGWGTPQGGYGSYWAFQQRAVLDRVSPALRAYFVYALLPMPAALDPVAAVRRPGWVDLVTPAWRQATWDAWRPMWSTPSFLDAAGLRPYRTGDGAIEALSDGEARARGLRRSQALRTYTFEPVRLRFDDAGRLVREPGTRADRARIFRATDRALYTEAMRGCLVHLLAGTGRAL